MAFSVTPTAGLRLDEVNSDQSGVALGTVVFADDGHEWIYAQASAGIADDAVVILTEPAMTVATGAGAWTNRNGTLVSGDETWLQKTAI